MDSQFFYTTDSSYEIYDIIDIYNHKSIIKKIFWLLIFMGSNTNQAFIVLKYYNLYHLYFFGYSFEVGKTIKNSWISAKKIQKIS